MVYKLAVISVILDTQIQKSLDTLHLFWSVHLFYILAVILQIKHHEVMEMGARVYVPVSVAESKISKRFDIIPSGTMCPNADEIAYLQRLVIYKVFYTT